MSVLLDNNYPIYFVKDSFFENAMNIYSLLLLFFIDFACVGAAITYQFSGGRFGDNCLSYTHAKWLSYKHKIPLLYREFRYSDKLMLHLTEQNIKSAPIFDKVVVLTKDNFIIDPAANVLYIVPFFSDFADERIRPMNHGWPCFEIDWTNAQFLQTMRTALAPINPVTVPIVKQSDAISVAVHVRKHEGPLLSDYVTGQVDPFKYADFQQGLRFPPESFYINQIQYLIDFFKPKRLLLFLFTDDNPQELLARFKKALPTQNLEISCRDVSTIGDDNLVVEDFFAMTQFDCLIRPQSNFSFVAAKIAQFILEIFPTKNRWEKSGERWHNIIEKTEIIKSNDATQIEYAFIAYATESYFPLLKVLLDSHQHFSQKPIIVYGVNADVPFSCNDYPLLITRRIDIDLNQNRFKVWCYKSRIIAESNVKYGIYVDADAIIASPHIDLLFDLCKYANPFPLCPIHPDDVMDNILQQLMQRVKITTKSMPYVHDNVILFSHKCSPFIKEWHNMGLSYASITLEDEKILNTLLWKYQATHYLAPIEFYWNTVDAIPKNIFTHPTSLLNPNKKTDLGALYDQQVQYPLIFHGCKNLTIAPLLLNHIKRQAIITQ